MFGLMVDAYKLRKKTEEFDCMLGELFAEHRGSVMAEPSAGVFLTLSDERMNRSRGRHHRVRSVSVISTVTPWKTPVSMGQRL